MTYHEFINGILSSRSNVKFEHSERHHIVPRCLGGKDDDSNLVYLTYQEHFIAHKLLVVENPDNPKLLYALFRMCDGKRIVTPEEYEDIKIRMRVFMSIEFSGEGNPFYQHHHSEETKLIMSKMKKTMYIGEGNPFYGKKHSQESLDKMSETHRNQRWIHKDNEETTVCTEDEYNSRIVEGWKPGRIRENFLGEGNPFYGRSHSKESREKISIAMKGENHPNYGKQLSEETKSKLRESFKNRVYYKICKNCGKEFSCRGANTKYCSECK